MSKIRNLLHSAVIVSAVFAAGQAKATVSYGWSLLVPLHGGFVRGSGLFTTVSPISGSAQVQTFTGTIDGIRITALLAPGSYGGNDNLIFDTPFYVNSNGISFTLASSDPDLGNPINLYSDSTQGYTTNGPTTFSMTGFSYSLASPTAVPEPVSMTLLATGLIGLATTGFRRKSR